MVKVLLKTLVIVLFFMLLLSSRVCAINLGSVAKNNFATVSIDKSTKFEMLFWNIEEEPYTIKLSINNAPKDWTVIIDPDEFILNKTIGEEYINLPYLDEDIKAKIINLFVKPSSDSKPGKYFISIKSEVRISQSEKNAITIVPGSILNFEVELEGFDITESNIIIESEENKIDFSENGFETNGKDLKISNFNEENIDKSYFYLIIVFLVIVISIIIYKK